MKNYPYFITWSKQQSQECFTLEKSDGVFFHTKEYGKLLDFSSTSYHVSFGHNNSTINQSITRQLNQFSSASPKAHFSLKEEVSHRLLKLLGHPADKVFYTTSGAESIENALKMARQLSGKKTIVALERCYHGATLGALSITGDWRNQNHFTVSEFTLRVPDYTSDPQARKFKETIRSYGCEKVAAVCLETITGGNGVYIPSKKWWSAVSRFCRENNIFLIADEIVCGFFRTGRPFGLHHYNMNPDFICLAKAISGGHIPFGAVIVKNSLVERFQQEVFSYGLTNFGHPLGLAAARGVFEIIDSQSWAQQFKENMTFFHQELEALQGHPRVKEVRFIGLLACIELNFTYQSSDLYQYGLYIAGTQGKLILAPATTITKKELSLAFSQLNDFLNQHKG